MHAFDCDRYYIISGRLVIVEKRRYLQATVECQFFKGVMHMALYRVCSNVEPLGNFLVA
jgi:hypothetical protein